VIRRLLLLTGLRLCGEEMGGGIHWNLGELGHALLRPKHVSSGADVHVMHRRGKRSKFGWAKKVREWPKREMLGVSERWGGEMMEG
jgi:hypothetical protein